MATNYKRMDEVRTILNKYIERGSYKSTARLLGISKNTVKVYVKRCEHAGLDLSHLSSISDTDLSTIIYKKRASKEHSREVEFDNLLDGFVKELSKRGVTRQLLWKEYKADHPEGYEYSQFCVRMSRRIKSKGLTLAMNHKPAEVMMLDYAGGQIAYFDELSGEERFASVLVAVLPYSQHTFAIALASQSTEDFVYGTVKSLEYFGGVPGYILSDNLKAYVIKADRYEPEYNALSVQLASFYNMDMQATRVARPKDKASVENMVRTVYTRLYARLRHEVFTSLEQINEAFGPLLEAHNSKPFQKRQGSRKSVFEQSEQALLQALPRDRFEIKKTTKSKIQKNYHAFLGEDKNYYSVPYKYVGKQVTIVYTRTLVEIYLLTDRIAVHSRLHSESNYQYVTQSAHQPKAHRIYEQLKACNDESFLEQAQSVGEHTHWAINHILSFQPNQDQAYKSCLGILRLSKRYGQQRLERACHRCRAVNRVNYKIVENILRHNLDQQPDTSHTDMPITIDHSNIRGSNYYH